MTYIFKKYALYYNINYGLAVAFKAVNGTPLHSWRQYAETGMDEATIRKLHHEHVEMKKRQAVRLAILTGPYMRGLDKPMLVIDVDKPPTGGDKEKKTAIMRIFAKEGYQVVNTPRGFHLHVFLDKRENLPYLLRLYSTGDENPEAIGEGGCLFPHPWSTVPSVRSLGENRWMRYSFVLPDGRRIAKYDKFLQYRSVLEPATMRLDEVVEDVSFILSCKVSFFSPGKTGFRPRITPDGKEIIRKRPLFSDFEEFYTSIQELPLPACVAWVLYHYADETGDDATATRLAVDFEELFPIHEKVKHGMRFLIASAVALFLAHVIEWIKFDEIIDVLQYAFEDWPDDEGYPLDKKLTYLFLTDEEGYVYPRYGGLGSLTPVQVWGCTDLCLYGRICRGRNPWRSFERMIKKNIIAKELYSPDDEI